jgi:cytochrome c553
VRRARFITRVGGLIAGVIAITPALGADPTAGQQKAQACVACHGEAGNSTNPIMPSLAGQPQLFIVLQLMQFRDGRRNDPQMAPFAAKLSDQDMNDLGAYFSAQKPVPPKFTADASKAQAGSSAARTHHCVSCHGGNLMGSEQIPRIAGQQFEYLRTQLKLYKAGARADIDGQMTSSAQPLSEEDIENLAHFIASFPPQ